MRSTLSRHSAVGLLAILALAAALTASAQPSTRQPTSDAGSLATAPDRFFSVDGQRIRFREVGRGEVVVLLHGRAGTLEAWAGGLADSLSPEFRVIAVDLRGHGQSSKPESPALYGPAMARDVVALLDHLQIRRAHLVGFSLGAVVTAYIAANFPARVRTASLLAGPFYVDSAATAHATASWIAEMESGSGFREVFRRRGMSDSAAAAASARMLAVSTPAALVAMTRAMGNLMLDSARVRTLGVPVLVAVGTADELLENSRRYAAWWPGSRLIEVPGIGHGGIIRQPAIVRVVRERLRAGP